MSLIEVASMFVSGHGSTANQIAERVNKSGMYTRADNKPVPEEQIDVRLSKYPDHYVKINGKWFEKNMDVRHIAEYFKNKG